MEPQAGTVNSVIDTLCHRILAMEFPPLLRIGINGVDGSGKTMFTKRLVEELKKRTQRQIISTTIDAFHHPKERRYQKGRASVEGFYRDSFDFPAIVERLLRPLSPHGLRTYWTRIFDVRTDQAVEEGPYRAEEDAILIMEGIFLFQKELWPYFDFKIYLDVPFGVTLERMLERDKQFYASEQEERELFLTRYKPGQELYQAECAPKELADVIIDNTDYEHPVIVKSVK